MTVLQVGELHLGRVAVGVAAATGFVVQFSVEEGDWLQDIVIFAATFTGFCHGICSLYPAISG